MTRRADRLFQIAELLRGRRLTTAQQLADWLHISPRTVYRDVRDLQLSGVPIEGEAGIGYRLSRSASLPPLTFTVDELAALAAGARMLETWGGASFAKGARGALAKIAAAMPADKRATLERLPIFAPSFHIKGEFAEKVDQLHLAIDRKRVVSFAYRDRAGAHTERRVGRWGWCTGERAGPSARGANCVKTSAISTSSRFAIWRYTSRSPIRRGDGSRIICAASR